MSKKQTDNGQSAAGMEEDFVGNEGPEWPVALEKMKTENVRFKQTVLNSCSN